MTARPLALAALACLVLAACDSGDRFADEAVGPPAQPQIEIRGVDGFTDLGGHVADIALIPNAQPFLGRGVAALDSGGFALLDFAMGEMTQLDGPRVGFLAAAPDFELRGAPAPLLLAAGGEVATPRAWVFLAEDGVLLDMPIDPIMPDGPLSAMCLEHADQGFFDVIVFSTASLERWRIRDRGGDRLAAERVETAPIDRRVVGCAEVNGKVAGVGEDGVTRVLGETDWGFADGTDVTAVEDDGDWWTFVARPSEHVASLIAPLSNDVDVVFKEGFNTPSTPAPTQLAASMANFGGSFSEGVLVAAQDDRVSVSNLGGVIDDADEVLNGGS